MSVQDKIQSLKDAGIRLQKPSYSNSIEIYTEGDYNDDDLVTKTSFRSVSEFITLYPTIKKILGYKNNIGIGPYNWEDRYSYLTDEECDLIEDLLGIAPSDSPADEPVYFIKTIKAYFRCSDGNRYKIVF